MTACGRCWTCSGHHGVDSGRIELDLGFGRGIGFYTQMIFEIMVPTWNGPVEVCGGGRYDGLARVLGSHRDDRGAGFAFGLERLYAVLQRDRNRCREVRRGCRGYLVTSGKADEVTAAAIDLATFLRERIQVPVVVSGLGFQGRGRAGPRAGPEPGGHRRVDAHRGLEPRARRRPLGP